MTRTEVHRGTAASSLAARLLAGAATLAVGAAPWIVYLSIDHPDMLPRGLRDIPDIALPGLQALAFLWAAILYWARGWSPALRIAGFAWSSSSLAIYFWVDWDLNVFLPFFRTTLILGVITLAVSGIRRSRTGKQALPPTGARFSRAGVEHARRG